MNRRLIHFLKLSCSALGLGVVLCACPAGFAPTGTFSGNRDGAVTTTNDGKESEETPLLGSGAGPNEGTAFPAGGGEAGFNPVIGSAPAGGGSSLPNPVDSPSGVTSNPVVAGDAGGIAARPDGSPVGRLPFLPAARRIWTGTEFNNEVPEGGTVTVTSFKGVANLRVIAEYRLANNALSWFTYPVGTQIRLIFIPSAGGLPKFIDTQVIETPEGVRSANVAIDDLPTGDGRLIAHAYEAFHHDAETGEYVMHHTTDFQEAGFVSFATPMKLMSFLNDFFTHELFTIEIKELQFLPNKGQ